MLVSGAAAAGQPDQGLRGRAITALAASIATHSRNSDGDPFDDDEGLISEIAAAIEHGVAVWSEMKEKLYQRKVYSILWALRSSPQLVVSYDPWDLAWVKEEALVMDPAGRGHTATNTLDVAGLSFVEQLVKQRLAGSGVRRLVCPKCKSKEVERISVQTRSADEGMTQMKQCTACFHRWR